MHSSHLLNNNLSVWTCRGLGVSDLVFKLALRIFQTNCKNSLTHIVCQALHQYMQPFLSGMTLKQLCYNISHLQLLEAPPPLDARDLSCVCMCSVRACVYVLLCITHKHTQKEREKERKRKRDWVSVSCAPVYVMSCVSVVSLKPDVINLWWWKADFLLSRCPCWLGGGWGGGRGWGGGGGGGGGGSGFCKSSAGLAGH